ncbi:GntP family permease [bacterium]|nr:GntP family permease [bacterium]RQV92043.1 MAG: GntP family permease [bacterium]
MLTLVFLLVIMVLIVIATTKWQVHPFLTLLIAAVMMGFLGGLDSNLVLSSLLDGFGETLKSIGIVIACGTVIGTFLEQSGAAQSIASHLLKVVGEKKAPLAMNITGLIVSIPVFCDSGFVILSSLNKAISEKKAISIAVLAVSLATGLYATHVFVPPTPGPLAAAATLGADIGLVLLLGLVVSIPTAFVGLLWARLFCKRFHIIPKEITESKENEEPNLWHSLSPIFIPIILIALRSLANYPSSPLGDGLIKSLFDFIGHPVVALLMGVFIAFGLKIESSEDSRFELVARGLKNAGAIILITGAGGAFGNILRATEIGDTIGRIMTTWNIGLFLPFLIAALLKSAQGSSTVAIITTSAIVSPLLIPMGLSTPVAKALVVLSIGAGSMTISHINDSYFWIVSQFSDMNTKTALSCYSLATLFQGLTGILIVALLAQLFI